MSARAVVYHDYEFDRGMQKYFYLERNRWLFVLRNYEWKSLFVLAPAFLATELAVLGQAVTGGWLKQKLRAYWSVLALTPHWRSARREIQKSRKIPDHELFRQVTTQLEVPGKETSLALSLMNRFYRIYWNLVAWILCVPPPRKRTRPDER